MNLNPQMLRAERHEEVGSLIQRDTGILIERWIQRAVKEQPHAARAHQQALLDHMPILLQSLGRGLADSLEPHETPHQTPAREHGEQRWEVGWSLPEVVRDYQILRMVLLEYLEESLERPLGFREILAINLALDEASGASVSAYVKQSEAELHEQTAILRVADQRKNDFMAMLAHELRNPLAPILTSVELLRLLSNQDATINHAREIIERQLKYVVRLVDDLLDMTRIARGKMELRRTVFDLNRAVSQATQTVRPQVESHAHRLTVESPVEAIYLDADESRIAQILINLLSNACKYTERGGQIGLKIARDGNEVVLRVSDTGLGIEPEMMGRIFDLFAQADRSLHRAQGGLGIGLTLVRQLVELHGGHVRALSEGVGKGSEFEVRLPIASPPQIPSLPTNASPPTKTTVAHRILIIEDNADARETLALLLQMLGHQTQTAATGPDGVTLALVERPQVVLVDLGLPGLDGFQVAKKIRSALGESVLLVALTGYAQEEDRQRTQDAGFDAHLPKPVELDELNRVMANVSNEKEL